MYEIRNLSNTNHLPPQGGNDNNKNNTTMPQNECLGIQDTSTGLWLISINSDGTYSWGNSWNAICFESDAARQAVLDDLGGSNFAPGRPPRRPNA